MPTILPPVLARKVTPWMLTFNQREGNLLGFTIVWLGLMLEIRNRNAFLFLSVPWVCPTLAALFLSRVRPKLWRGSFFNPQDIDRGDPVVMRLAEIWNSNEARRHLWQHSLKLSWILFAILGGATVLLRHSLAWAFPSSRNHFFWESNNPFWMALGTCCFGCWMAQAIDYVVWCLTLWAKRESDRGLAGKG